MVCLTDRLKLPFGLQPVFLVPPGWTAFFLPDLAGQSGNLAVIQGGLLFGCHISKSTWWQSLCFSKLHVPAARWPRQPIRFCFSAR